MLTRKTTYGIRALAALSRAYLSSSRRAGTTSEQGSLSVAELAAREGIPEHFLSVILSDLRQRGIVRGRRGPDGGYQLAVDPRTLNLADVVESLGGPLFPFACLERKKGDPARCSECPGPNRCPAESALGRASAAAYAALSAVTIFDLIDEEPLPNPDDAGDSGSRSELRQKRAEARDGATTPVRTRGQRS